jgi:hypothetical protein
MAPNPSSGIISAAISSFAAWRIYRRVRRNIGKQPFQPRRLIFRMAIFSLICAGMICFAWPDVHLLLAIGGGWISGVALGFVGLRHTRFEALDKKQFYTPNTYLGVGISLLLVARVVYRLMQFEGLPPSLNHSATSMRSPLTFCIFGLLAGYYLVYFGGVYVRCQRLKEQKVPAIPSGVSSAMVSSNENSGPT